MILINSAYCSGFGVIKKEYTTYVIVKYNNELYHIFRDSIKPMNVRLLDATGCVNISDLHRFDLKTN